MRDRYTDIIKICKGYYDKDKYDSVLSAIKSYQSKVCGVDEKYITYDDVLNFGLFKTAEKYFKQSDWIEMLKERIWKNDILFQSLFHKDDVNFDGAYICNLLIGQIDGLQVRDDHGWSIDLSDYQEKEIII